MMMELDTAQFEGKTSEQMDDMINDESIEWEKAAMTLPPVLHFDCRLINLEQAVVALLAENDDNPIADTQAKVDLEYKKILLARMQTIRKDLEPQLRAARLANAGISVPGHMVVPEDGKLH